MLTAAVVIQWFDDDVSESTLRWLAMPTLALMGVVAAPLLKHAWHRHSIESSLFFAEVFAILAAGAWGAAWLTDHVGWTEDMVYVAIPVVFVALPVAWLAALVVVRARRRRLGTQRWAARMARRTLVLAAAGGVAWGCWRASGAIGVQSQALTAAWIVGLSVAMWHIGAIAGSNRNQMIWGSRSYTTEGLAGDFTGDGIATIGDVRRRFTAWVRDHKLLASVFVLACAGGCLWSPDYVGIAVALMSLIVGWVFGERAQDVVDASERDEHDVVADAA